MKKAQIDIMHEAGFLSAAEAAELIGAQHVGTIHRMVKREELVGERVGTHWYIEAASLLTNVQSSKVMTERVTAFMRANAVPVFTTKKGSKHGKRK